MDAKYVKFNKDKFKEAILYLLSKYPERTLEGKKKLAKLLYFADFNFFEAFESPFTGATYRALQMGPVPQELDSVLDEMHGKEIEIGRKPTGLPNDAMTYRSNTEEADFKH